MHSNRKPPGSIHKIREFELEKIRLADEFDILQIVGEGWFGKILLVEHRATDTEMVLKALPKPYVSIRDFYREFHFGLHLGVHKNIVTTYDIAFETAGFYVFTQEYALLGDLTSNISDTGIGELHSKRVAKQIASALDYMHSKDIVHRDVKLDNVLIYRSDFSKVKLCDFGESYETGTMVERRNEWLPYSPPEVLQVEAEGTYKADPSHDVWQFAIVIFVCLTGCLPWQKAAYDDPRYFRYLTWQQSNMVLPIRRTPKLFKLLSSKGCRMFRKFLEPRPERRPKGLADLSKFLDDRWLTKGAEKDLAENEPDELCPSMYSFHSSPDEKNKLLSTLAEHGIETTVDRRSKRNRIKDWIESSVIVEDDEEDDSGSATPSSSVSREPIVGHISSIKSDEARKKEIRSTIKDASNKHFDPRTGALQEGPSEMGVVFPKFKSMGNLATLENGSNLRDKHINNSYANSTATLTSRTDLISSGGQSFHSELNLNKVPDNVIPAEPLVNARLDIPLNNSKNDFDHNAADMSFYKESLSLTNNNISYYNSGNSNNNNNNNYQYSSNRRIDQINPKYFSSSDLNVRSVVATTPSTANSGFIKSNPTNHFQSLTTISVPEINQQFQNTQIKDSGYGSKEHFKPVPYNESPYFVRQHVTQPVESHIKTMKDTPYDRINIQKKNK